MNNTLLISITIFASLSTSYSVQVIIQTLFNQKIAFFCNIHRNFKKIRDWSFSNLCPSFGDIIYNLLGLCITKSKMLVLKRNSALANGAVRVLSTTSAINKPSKLQLNNAEPPEKIRQAWFAPTFPLEKMVRNSDIKKTAR